MGSVPTTDLKPRRGTFRNGMDHVTWGSGPKSLLFIQGGPGSAVPKGIMLRMSGRLFAPYVEAGFTVRAVTRRRHMPPRHTISDMADDYARMITEELGGRVDLVVGESSGGMIAQYLAALHPECLDRAALVVTGAQVSDWGKEVDHRLARALARGDKTGVGAAFAEYLLPRSSMRWLRRLVGPLVGRWLLSGRDYPASDLLVEVESEEDFDSRAVLPRIQAPVVLICGDRDLFFPKDVVEETAALIPDCTLVWYEGLGHVRAASSKRVVQDVLEFVGRS